MSDATKGARRALLVGIDRYPHLPTRRHLFGSVRDAEAVAAVLEDRFGFAPGDLHLLLGGAATRAAFLSRLDGLLEATGEEDLLVVHWSGHGSQCPAPVGPGHVDEPDGLAETLVPVDARGPTDERPTHERPTHERPTDERQLVGDILDDEIRRRLARLHQRGAFTTWIFDCCHAGHVYRRPRTGERWLPPPLDPPRHAVPPAPPWRVGRGGRPRPLRQVLGDRQVIFAACRDDQTAGERLVARRDGSAEIHGHFSWSLLQELTADDPASTAGEVFRRVRLRMLSETRRQTPLLVGAEERLLFGTAVRAPQPWVEVGRVMPAQDLAQDLGLDQELELEAGAAQGLVAGSRWQIQPPGAARPERRSRLGVAEVTDVGTFRSLARRVDGGARPLVAGGRAFLLRAARPDLRLPVIFASGVPRELAAATGPVLSASPRLRWVGQPVSSSRGVAADPEGAELAPHAVHLHRVPAGSASREEPRPALRRILGPPTEDVWALCDGSGECLAVVPVAAGALALRRRLERRARFRWALGLRNPDPRTRPAGLALRLLDSPRADPANASADDLPCYRDDDAIRFEIVHRHRAPLYVYVLGFGLEDHVVQVFPPPGAEELLRPGVRHRVGVADDDEFYLYLPEDFDPAATPGWRRPGGMEFLALFATSEATRFRLLTAEAPAPLRRGGGTLERWLGEGEAGGRDAMRSGDGVWGVDRVAYRLLRRPARRFLRRPAQGD